MVHDLADLLGVGLAQRAADHGEILAEDEHLAAVDRAVAGDDPVAGIAALPVGVVAAAGLEDVEFLKGPLVQQQLDAFPGRQLAPAVLVVDALDPSGPERLVLQRLEVREGALKGRSGRRAGFRLLQALSQLRTAREGLLDFHGASSNFAFIYAEIKSRVNSFFIETVLSIKRYVLSK